MKKKNERREIVLEVKQKRRKWNKKKLTTTRIERITFRYFQVLESDYYDISVGAHKMSKL
jgi:hypothetical protein